MKKILSFVLVLVMILSVVSLTACGKKKTGAEVVASTADFSVTQGMFAYFYKVTYSSYESYLEGLGVDTNVSLKQQECPYVLKGDKTWFTYFVEMTKDYVSEILALCQEAYEAGVTLDDEDIKSIDSYMTEINNAAKNYGAGIDEYVSLVVKNPFTGVDLRKCLEMEALAAKYSDEFYNTIDLSDDKIEEYYQANKAYYDTVDLYAFTVAADAEDIDYVRDAIAKLQSAEDGEEFLRLIREYIEADYIRNGREIDEAVQATIEDYLYSCEFRGVSTSDFNTKTTSDWAKNAKVGETYLEESDESFTVYFIIREMSRDESLKRNVRIAFFSAETYKNDTIPQKVYKVWEESGFTEEKFIELNKEHSQDEDTRETGGLYTNIGYGDYVKEFNDWLFAEERTAGDHGLVETSLGWHLVYYVGENEIAQWESDVITEYADEMYNKMIDEYYYSLVYDDAVIAEIDA